MKKKIAFIEMETHSALLEQWYFLVRAMPSIDFHFFVSPKVLEKLTAIPEQHLTIITSVAKTDFADFDSVVVNTMHRNYADYAEVFTQKPVLCLVHNLNFSLFFKHISWKQIWKEKDRFAYFLKLYAKEKIASKRKIITQAKWFGVISASALDTIQKHGVYAKKSCLIPMNYCKSFAFPSEEVIQIVMPGNVSNKRKDVDLVFRILQKLQPISKMHITFLGKPENEAVLNELEKVKKSCHPNITITHYHRFIPWEEYSQVIAKAHLLLCPIKQDTSFYWVEEQYGATKVSGAEADCIYNGKIGIFPESYPKMDWYNWYYSSEEKLVTLLENLTIPNLVLAYKHLQPYAEKFTFEKVKSELEKELLKL